MADGVSNDPSTTTAREACSPGKTMPTAGVTVIQVAPDAAVNEMGELSVASVTVWAAAGLGGVAKVSVAGVKLKVEGGVVMFSVTAITSGAATPVTVTVTDET